jgi:hypothetical protein
MRVPKRFKLHEVAELDDTDIMLLDVGLVALNSNGMAIVPTTSKEDVDLPFVEAVEKKDLNISSKAMKEAVKGKTRIGEIHFRKNDQMVRAGEDKNWILMKNPDPGNKSVESKVVKTLKKQLAKKSPKGYHYVEVCLDTELLATLSRAIGTNKVRLRFLVNSHSKVADGQGSNLIQIQPYRKDGCGEEAILSMLLTNK